jgi:hypothetical protein
LPGGPFGPPFFKKGTVNMTSLTNETTPKNLQRYIEGLLGAHQLLDSFQKTKHFCTVISVEGSIPLHIERHGDIVTIAQYISTDDDLLPSPEIVFRVNEYGQWLPQEAHFSIGEWKSCIAGSWLSNIRERLYIRKFSEQWLKRLSPQMYERGEVMELWGEND